MYRTICYLKCQDSYKRYAPSLVHSIAFGRSKRHEESSRSARVQKAKSAAHPRVARPVFVVRIVRKQQRQRQHRWHDTRTMLTGLDGDLKALAAELKTAQTRWRGMATLTEELIAAKLLIAEGGDDRAAPPRRARRDGEDATADE